MKGGGGGQVIQFWENPEFRFGRPEMIGSGSEKNCIGNRGLEQTKSDQELFLMPIFLL